MKTSFATRVSGTHIAQSRWTHSPCTVCLNAPPSLGHNIQDYNRYGELQILKRMKQWYQLLGFRGIQCISGTTTDPPEYMVHRSSLAKRTVRVNWRGSIENLRTLMYSKITAITKYNCISVFPFGIIANSTCWILRREGEVWLGDILCLDFLLLLVMNY